MREKSDNYFQDLFVFLLTTVKIGQIAALWSYDSNPRKNEIPES